MNLGGNGGRSDEYGFFMSLREEFGQIVRGVLRHTDDEAAFMEGSAQGEAFYKSGDFGVGLGVEESDEVVHHDGHFLFGGGQSGVNETGGRQKKAYRMVAKVTSESEVPPDAFSIDYDLADLIGVRESWVGLLCKQKNA